jgi:hypothetical protein
VTVSDRYECHPDHDPDGELRRIHKRLRDQLNLNHDIESGFANVLRRAGVHKACRSEAVHDEEDGYTVGGGGSSTATARTRTHGPSTRTVAVPRQAVYLLRVLAGMASAWATTGSPPVLVIFVILAFVLVLAEGHRRD